MAAYSFIDEKDPSYSRPQAGDTTELAYLGDAVYEVMIRTWVLTHAKGKIHQKNKETIRYVRADGQAKAARNLVESGFLTDEEAALVKRGRNHTNTNHPRSASAVAYKWATGFEALVGWHFAAGHEERLKEIVREAVRIVNAPEEEGEEA